jgi:hypothetical protein
MAGRPIRRGRATARPAARLAFDRARARVLATAIRLDSIRPGAGDEFLARATVSLETTLDQALSGFPAAESTANA